ncbi:ADL044Wp [Eremothecium gossypii ATCC 10895]|uniref:ADL044Wp n=1 Tax=Eremothecium gossypii (strain ATCC 10895 / CBS 109.51 / FGSC 9923 / NRRL Y-1056) TaxID=284811 RepID=Q75AG2_EREGS|nr:ADL044Wp [Eremothecium gossypii ATCC 10895]AAS51876.1 ADL044Wp [Eremothecium gossypii ATCC 10895]AEY96174.1 FADL044Wp [Eremothecium gossypii FDAG1]
MPVVNRELDRAWNVVRVVDACDIGEAQVIEDALNFDDVLSNTSSDESECVFKPNTADNGGGLESEAEGSEYGQSTFVQADSEESTVPKEHSECDNPVAGNGERATHPVSRIGSLSTLQVVLLTSSTTVVAYYWLQQLWFWLRPQNTGYPSPGVMTPSVLGLGNDDTLVFNSAGLPVPFEKYGTKRFMVDFENKVAYPVHAPEDFLALYAGKYVVSNVLSYQVALLYRLNYEWLPKLAYKYQVFRTHIHDSLSAPAHQLGAYCLPSYSALRQIAASASDNVREIVTIYIQRTCRTVEISYEGAVHALSTMFRELQPKLNIPLQRFESRLISIKQRTVEPLLQSGLLNYNALRRWGLRKTVLVATQVRKYVAKCASIF